MDREKVSGWLFEFYEISESNVDFVQRALLAEAIKSSDVPVEKLAAFIKNEGIVADWPHMLLPYG